MKNFSREQDTWAGRLAARLRVLQATCAEDAPETRQPLLQEEIAQALREAPPAQRAVYLEALAERFPVWQAPAVPIRETADTVDIPQIPPEELVARLLAAAPSLPVEQRQEFARLLTNVGLVNAPKAPAFDLPPELRAQLPLSPNQPVDATRSLRLFASLVEMAAALDQLAWSVWKGLAPQSIIRRDAGPDGDFRKLAARYLSGDSEVSGQQVAQLLDKTRHVIAGLLAAIGPAGGTFTRNYLAKFSPEAIESQAGTGGGGFFVGAEQRNWRKYLELFNQVSGATVEHEILNAIIQYAESAILGSKRPPNPSS
jgi:hypothetical protein